MVSALLTLIILAFAAGGLGALLFGGGVVGRGIAAFGTAVGSGACLASGLAALVSDAPAMTFSMALSSTLPAMVIALRIDDLSALFLVIIGLVGLALAVYGFSYTAGYEERYSLRMVGVTLNALLLSLSLQVIADNGLTFLFSWEIMSLSAYWLVLTEHDQPGTTRAGIWYIAMTHAGFAALMAAFLLLSGDDLASSFSLMRSNAQSLSPALRNAIFILALFGFGTKAGIVPLHIWLPMAHPVAPSHVSALLSGVVIKMGIYGIFRVVIDLLGVGPVWWGGAVLLAGAASSLLGVLYALMEHDLKRLLAYHSIENIGIILIGVGAGMISQCYGLSELAILGFAGGLYHTINHATFKGTLFLGAGSIMYATHTRNLEEMGGLIKRMPVTAICFLIGAAAISALPPLNGFASEWIIFQTLLGGFNIPQPEVALLMPIAVGVLALTSGLAAACFVKAFGIAFLAMPRSRKAEQAREAPLPMRAGMALLTLSCIGLGLAPFAVLPVLSGIMTGILDVRIDQAAFAVEISAPGSRMSPILIMSGLLLIICLVPAFLRLIRANLRLRTGSSWGCGRSWQTPRMEYTATAFAEPLRRVFAEIYRPTKELTIELHPGSRYFVESIEYRSGVLPWFEKFLYGPLLRLIRLPALAVRRTQSGSLSAYLLYVILILIILLLTARF